MNSTTAYKTLLIISGLMFIAVAGGMTYALLAEECLPTMSYTMIFLTMVNGGLFFIVGLNLKSKAEKGERNR